MKLFLDSSAIIELFKNNKKVIEFIEEADEIYTSSLCAYEVLVGEKYIEGKGSKSHSREASEFFKVAATLPFLYSDAEVASDIMKSLSLKGKKMPEMDALIAAQAIAKEATILTKDSRHFAIIGAETELTVQTL